MGPRTMRQEARCARLKAVSMGTDSKLRERCEGVKETELEGLWFGQLVGTFPPKKSSRVSGDLEGRT